MTAFPPKSEFRKWLRSLPPDEVVATNWNCFRCPLAMWLARTGVINKPYINPGTNRFGAIDSLIGLWGEGLGDAPLPNWANAFGIAIDNLGYERRGNSVRMYGPVTAADCLAVLRRTPRA